LICFSGKAVDTSPATPIHAVSSPAGNTPTAVARGNLRGLVDQIERLQSEKALINDELLTLRSSAAKSWLAEFDLLRGLNTELEKHKKKLEDDICQLRLSAVSLLCHIFTPELYEMSKKSQIG